MIYFVDDGSGDFNPVEARNAEDAIRKTFGDDIEHMSDHFEVEVREKEHVPGDVYSVSVQVVTQVTVKRLRASVESR